MAYTKNPVWTETTAITPSTLNKLETQYEEAVAYIDAHEAKSAPHSGHATVSALNAHINDTNAHNGVLAKASDLTAHVNASAPHSGHVTTSTFNSHANASAPHSGHATVTALNNHTPAVAPHSGHVKGTMRVTVSSAEPSSPSIGDIWIIID